MKAIETKRCRNMRRVIMGLFIVCAYMLSTPFVYAYITFEGEEKLISETALNLAFGNTSMSEMPVYRNTVVGIMYLLIPLIGFFFEFFDKRSNVKNLVGIVLGVVGCLSIALPIGFNGDLGLGVGAFVDMILYMFVTMLSGIAVFMKLEDMRKDKSEESAPRLARHE